VTASGLVPGLTVGAARRLAAQMLRDRGIDSAELDARILTGHAAALDHAAMLSQHDRPLDDTQAAALTQMLRRRLDGVPVARIVGIKEFWGLPLQVTAATLVPRPETETVVETALALLDADGPRGRALRIADLGAGTGALLLALLSELPNAAGVATDIDTAALAAARANARRLQLDGRAHFVACDFGTALSGGFDVVVSNPPYIASGDINGLAAEVRHDPRRALDGGRDGLACYRAIAADARRLLAPGGHLVVEVGLGQEPPVAALLRAGGLEPLPAKPDLSGIARALPARVPAGAP
jgi:release factor glutamine methyltransferase